MNHVIVRILVPAVLIGQAGFAAAQSDAARPDTAQWECKYCLVPQGVYGEVGLRSIGLSGEGFSRYGRYTGLDRDGAFVGVDVAARYAASGTAYASDFYATDLGLPTRALEYAGGRQGTYRIRLQASELPLREGDGAKTPFSGIETGALTLPQTWLRGVTTADMGSLAASEQDVTIRSKRTRIALGLDLSAGGGWDLGVRVRQDNRTGTRALGSAIFFNSTTLVAPIDYATSEIEAYASYASRLAQVRFAYLSSVFRDLKPALSWDNPFAEVMPGATGGQMALPPNSQFHQVSATGAYQLAERTRVSANLAIGRMEQNDPYLPVTVNPTLTPLVGLARAGLMGRIDTRRADVKVATAVGDVLGLNFSMVYDDRANKTPVEMYNWVTTDMLVATSRENMPFSSTRHQYKASADYRIASGSRASVGVDRDAVERSYQEAVRSTEDTVWAKLAVRARLVQDATLSFSHGRRRIDEFQTLPWLPLPENPLLRKYNLADRVRDQVGVRIAMMPWDVLTLGFDLNSAKENYANSRVGLTDANRYGAGADGALQLGSRATVHAYYIVESVTSHQAGAQSVTNAPDWTAENKDVVRTGGVGIKYAVIQNRFDIGVDWANAHSLGDIRVDAGSADPQFPRIESSLRSIKVAATYRMANGLFAQLSFLRERYETANWAEDGVGVTTLPNVLNLGVLNPNYEVRVASLAVRYRF